MLACPTVEPLSSDVFPPIRMFLLVWFFVILYTVFACSSKESAENTNLTQAATTEVGGDEPDEGQPSLEEALSQLGLTTLTETFQREQIDFDSLVSQWVKQLSYEL